LANAVAWAAEGIMRAFVAADFWCVVRRAHHERPG
jgi:hypothetical protein